MNRDFEQDINEYFKESTDIPRNLKIELHQKLEQSENRMLRKNILLSCISVFIINLAILVFAYALIGSIVAIVFTLVYFVFSVFLSIILTIVSKKEQLRGLDYVILD